MPYMQSFSSPHLFLWDNYSFNINMLCLYNLSLQKLKGIHNISGSIAKSFQTGNIQKTLTGKSSAVRAFRVLENEYFLLFSLPDSTRMFPVNISGMSAKTVTYLLDFYKACFLLLKPVEPNKGFKRLNLTQVFIFACLFFFFSLYLPGRNSNQPANK